MTVTLRQALTEGFAPLLRADRPPLVKHEGGAGHEQLSHGNWARGIRPQEELTEEQIANQPEFLRGTTWTEVTGSGQVASAAAAVFPPEFVDDLLGPEYAGTMSHEEGLAQDFYLQRVWFHSHRVFVDPVNQVMSVVNRAAFSSDAFETLKLEKTDGGTKEKQRLAAAMDTAHDKWFVNGKPRSMTTDEYAEQRVRRLLTSAAALQKSAPIGPVILALEPPTYHFFSKFPESADDDPIPVVSAFVGVAFRASPKHGDGGTIDLPRIAMNMNHSARKDSTWTANPNAGPDGIVSPYLGTLVHEWGHHVGYQSGRSPERTEGLLARYENEVPSATGYGLTTIYEMEAEGFAASFLRRNNLDVNGMYTQQAEWAEENLGVEPGKVEFITLPDGMVVPVAKSKMPSAIACSFDRGVGSLLIFDDGRQVVTKHGDHDQQSHGNWARGIAKIPDTVGSYSRMTEERIRDFFPNQYVDDGYLIWHDPSANNFIVSPPPLEDRSGIEQLDRYEQMSERIRPSAENIAKAVNTIARLQEAAPVRNLSVALMHEAFGEYADTGPDSPWGQSQTMMAFASDARIRTRIVEHPSPEGYFGKDSGIEHVIEVSFDRIAKTDLQYEYMRKNPVEYVLAHEWAHAISFDRHGEQKWSDFRETLDLTALDRGYVMRHHAPLEPWAVREMESALEAATGEDVKLKHIVGHNAKRHQVTREQAQAVGWSAYGMSDYSEAYAEAFAAWALGASDTVPEMTTWGLDNFDWESWVTLQDGTVVPVGKAAGRVVGIGCTFDPQVGPVWLTDTGEVMKHGDHNQLTHGSWADGRRREEGGGRPRKVTRIGSQEMMDLAERLGAQVDMGRLPLLIAEVFPQQYNDAIDAWWEDQMTMLRADPQRVVDLNEQLGTIYAIQDGDFAYQEQAEGEVPLTVESFSQLTGRSQRRIITELVSRLSDDMGMEEFADMVIEGLSDYEWDRTGGRLVDRVDAKKMAQNAVSSGMESVPLERLVKAVYSLQGEIALSDDYIRQPASYGEEMRRIMVAMRDGEDIPVAITTGGRVRVGDDAVQALDDNIVRSYGGIISDPDIQSRLSKRLRDDMSYGLIKAWAETSNKTPIAATIQQAAAEEFGIADAAAPPSGTPLVNEDIRGVARAFVRAQYEATQKMLAEQFPDTTHFVLFRGGDSDGRFDDTSTTGEDWRESTLTSRPMASFSTSMGEAREFMGGVGKLFAAAVPRERILSTPFTGNGAVIESEFVVLGGPMRGRRADSFDNDTPFAFDPDMLPMGETEFIMIDGQPVPIGKAAVTKHGDHDQSTHGNWARGRTQNVESDAKRTILHLMSLSPSVSQHLDESVSQFFDEREYPDTMLILDGDIRRAAKQTATRAVASRLPQDNQTVADAAHLVGEWIIGDPLDPLPLGVDGMNTYERAAKAIENGGTIDGKKVTFRIKEYRVPLSDPRPVIEAGYGFPEEGTDMVGTFDDPAFRQRVIDTALEEASRLLIDQWSASSNLGSESTLIQQAAQQEFGLGMAEDPGSVRRETAVSSRLARSFVRAQYEATQQTLAEQFPDVTHFVLYRGGDSQRRYVDVEGYDGQLVRSSDDSFAQQATLKTRPMASFSAEVSTARSFAGAYDLPVFAAAIPRERILSTPLTGNGCLPEMEFVVLGGPIRGVVSVAGFDNLPMGATEFITVDGVPIPIGKAIAISEAVAKHLQGTAFDHDQSTHAGGRARSYTGAFRRLSDDDIIAMHMEGQTFGSESARLDAIDQVKRALKRDGGLQVWHHQSANVSIVATPRGDSPTALSKAMLPTQEDIDDVVRVVAQLQDNAPMRNMSIAVVGPMTEDLKSMGITNRMVEMPQVVGFTFRPPWELDPTGDTFADVVGGRHFRRDTLMEVSPQRAKMSSYMNNTSLPSVAREDPTAFVIAHEWSHALQPPSEPFTQDALIEHSALVDMAIGRYGNRITVAQAKDMGWTAYGMSNPREAAADAFGMWALGGDEQYQPMIDWGRRAMQWDRFVTMPDGRIVNLEKAMSEVVGIACTFDPTIGPYLIHADGTFVTNETMTKHLGAKHNQLTHGRWAHGGVPHGVNDLTVMEDARKNGHVRRGGIRIMPNGDIRGWFPSDIRFGNFQSHTNDIVNLNMRNASPEEIEEAKADIREKRREWIAARRDVLEDVSDDIEFITDAEEDALSWMLSQRSDFKTPEIPSNSTYIAQSSIPAIARVLDSAHADARESSTAPKVYPDDVGARIRAGTDEALRVASELEYIAKPLVFLHAYREGIANGLTDSKARRYGEAMMLRAERIAYMNNLRRVNEWKDSVGFPPDDPYDATWRNATHPSDALRARARKFLERGRVAVAVPAETFDEVIADGKLKNQYQSNTSSGMYSPQKRRMYEAAYIGVSIDATAKDRPIYGYVYDPQGEFDNGIDDSAVIQYGDVRLALRSDVRQRTTVTGGDSLDARGIAIRLDGDHSHEEMLRSGMYRAAQPSAAEYANGDNRNLLYTEAQIHSGVTLDDVEHVYVSTGSKWFDDSSIDSARRSASTAAGKYVQAHMRAEEYRSALDAAGRQDIPVSVAPSFITLANGQVIPLDDRLIRLKASQTIDWVMNVAQAAVEARQEKERGGDA